jgi:hypothetical protein
MESNAHHRAKRCRGRSGSWSIVSFLEQGKPVSDRLFSSSRRFPTNRGPHNSCEEPGFGQIASRARHPGRRPGPTGYLRLAATGVNASTENATPVNSARQPTVNPPVASLPRPKKQWGAITIHYPVHPRDWHRTDDLDGTRYHEAHSEDDRGHAGDGYRGLDNGVSGSPAGEYRLRHRPTSE